MRFPFEEEFGGSDFLDSKELKELGERIISEKFPYYDGEVLIDYRWKRRGGSSGGNVVLGKCTRLTGLARHLSLGVHYSVWLAVDHCKAYQFNDEQLEALVYHELCHIERDEPKDEDKPVTWRTRGHDSEVFFAELREYGAWRPTLEQLVETVRQLPLPMEIATPV